MKIRAVSPSGEVQVIEVNADSTMQSSDVNDYFEIRNGDKLKALIPKSWMVEFDAS